MSPTTTSVTPPGALQVLGAAIAQAATDLYGQAPPGGVVFETPRRLEHGDFSTNVAFSYAKIARKPPPKIAAEIHARLTGTPGDLRELVSTLEPAGGFINVRLAPAVWQPIVREIVSAGDSFGRGPKREERISLEFGSANPTGPLVVVQGRALSIGSTLANAYRFAGYNVTTEWIINDAGSQMETLARSLFARYRALWDSAFPFPEDGYPGEYVSDLAKSLNEREGDRWVNAPETEWLPYFSRFGRDQLVDAQKDVARRFQSRNDLWTSEKDLHDAGKVQAGIAALREHGHVYESEGATWARAAALGDDKDRVIVRSDGRPTYFAADIAYHWDKFARGADRIIDILGPDHHGYIGRLAALAKAFGREGKIEVLIAQQVTLMHGNEKVSSSKRAGNIITLEEVIEEVGVDAARFFFCMLSPEQPLTFDLDLAKKQSDENPVYYVQYGHARIASVIRKASAGLVEAARSAPRMARLEHPSELALMRRLAQLGEVVESAALNHAPHRLTRYAREVAADFHQFYSACIILIEDQELSAARLALALATQQVLQNLLAILGISAPDSM